MKEGKYAKTFAKIVVTAILLMRDMWKKFLPKSIEICMEKPCWCPSVWAPVAAGGVWKTRIAIE